MEEKRYFVNDDYPSETWEDILGLTTETARSILSDDEFVKWYKERNERYPGHYLPLEYWMEGTGRNTSLDDQVRDAKEQASPEQRREHQLDLREQR